MITMMTMMTMHTTTPQEQGTTADGTQHVVRKHVVRFRAHNSIADHFLSLLWQAHGVVACAREV